MKKQPTVGIVVLTYNSEAFVSKCLESIDKSTYKQYLCVLVDNNSTDHTLKIVKKKYPKVKIIKNNFNSGYAGGNNVGISHLLKIRTISHILILNPDTIISPDLINELITFMNRDKRIGIAGPVITYAHNPNKIWYAGGYLNKLFIYTKHPYMNTNIKEIKSIPQKTDFITGACMMVKKEVFSKIGLLPEEYFMYFEDVDFCQKAIKYNYLCSLLGKPLVRHFVSASAGTIGSNNLTPLRAFYYARNPFIYIKKNIQGWKKNTAYFGQVIIRLPYYFIIMLLILDFRSLICYFKGVWISIFYRDLRIR